MPSRFLVVANSFRNPFIDNFWDPANGLVPSTGFQNSPSNQDSPTVVIVGGNEFGQINGGPDVSFSSTGFALTENLPHQFVAFGQYGITLTETAFQSVNLTANTFPGFTYGISGDVISIFIPLTTVPPYDYSASFSVNTSEPSSLAVVLLAGVGRHWRTGFVHVERLKADVLIACQLVEAIAAGVTDRLWDTSDLIALLEERGKAVRAHYAEKNEMEAFEQRIGVGILGPIAPSGNRQSDDP